MKITPAIAGIGAGVAGLLVGSSIGAVSAEPEQLPAPPPVTVTATPEPAPTVTVSAAPVTTTEVPKYCLDALDDAEAIFTLNAEVMDMWSEHFQWDSALFTDMSVGDLSGMDSYIDHLDAQTKRVNEITDELSYNPFNLNKGFCREAAEE